MCSGFPKIPLCFSGNHGHHAQHKVQNFGYQKNPKKAPKNPTLMLAAASRSQQRKQR